MLVHPLRDIPDNIRDMCLWAIRDDESIDFEMINIILTNEEVDLLDGQRSDLTWWLIMMTKRMAEGKPVLLRDQPSHVNERRSHEGVPAG